MLSYHFGQLELLARKHFFDIIGHSEEFVFVVYRDYSTKIMREEMLDQDTCVCYTICGSYEEPGDIVAAMYES